MAHRTRSVVAGLAFGLTIVGTALAADQPPDDHERLAPAVAQTQGIAREVELRHRLPDGRRLAVAEVTTMLGVATLETLDPVGWSGRSIETDNGVYVSLCGRAARRHCAITDGGGIDDAPVARRQAVALARQTLLETELDLVVVALPQSPTRNLMLVFERGLFDPAENGTDARLVDRLTRDRLYATAGLVAFSDVEESLALVKLRSRR